MEPSPSIHGAPHTASGHLLDWMPLLVTGQAKTLNLMQTDRSVNLVSNFMYLFLLKKRGREGILRAMKSLKPIPFLSPSPPSLECVCETIFAAPEPSMVSIQMWKLVLTAAAAQRTSPAFKDTAYR